MKSSVNGFSFPFRPFKFTVFHTSSFTMNFFLFIRAHRAPPPPPASPWGLPWRGINASCRAGNPRETSPYSVENGRKSRYNNGQNKGNPAKRRRYPSSPWSSWDRVPFLSSRKLFFTYFLIFKFLVFFYVLIFYETNFNWLWGFCCVTDA